MESSTCAVKQSGLSQPLPKPCVAPFRSRPLVSRPTTRTRGYKSLPAPARKQAARHEIASNDAESVSIARWKTRRMWSFWAPRTRASPCSRMRERGSALPRQAFRRSAKIYARRMSGPYTAANGVRIYPKSALRAPLGARNRTPEPPHMVERPAPSAHVEPRCKGARHVALRGSDRLAHVLAFGKPAGNGA